MRALKIVVIVVTAVLSGAVTAALLNVIWQGEQISWVLFIFGPCLFLFALGAVFGAVWLRPSSATSRRRSARRQLVNVGEPNTLN